MGNKVDAKRKGNKKAFQLNANRPLADSMVNIVNKFEHLCRRVLYSEVQLEQARTCPRGSVARGAGSGASAVREFGPEPCMVGGTPL